MYKLVVLFSVVALAAAKPGAGLLAYSVVPAVSSVSQYSSSVVHPSVVSYSAPAVYAPAVAPAVVPVAPYTLAQAPHSPAVVLDPVHGVPLDTPEVVAARAAHYQAKALSGVHHLRKRSAPVVYSSVAAVSPLAYSSPVAYSSPLVSAYSTPVVSAYSAPVVSAYSAAPVVSAYSSPVVSAYSPYAYSAVAPKAYSVHPW